MASLFLRKNGFTLLEILLAIFIFSIVITTVYSSYRATFRNVEITESEANQAEQARIILERLTTDLESVYGGDEGFLRGEQKEINGERADSLSCTSSAHLVFQRREQGAGLTVLSYSVSEDAQTGLMQLYRSDRPMIQAKAAAETEGEGDLLGRGIVSFQLSYVDGEGGEEDFWESGRENEEDDGAQLLPVMPHLVRIEIRLARSADDTEGAVFRTSVAVHGARVAKR